MLIASIYSVNLFYSIQGTPKHGLPEGQVELLYVSIAKPNIYLLVKTQEYIHPVYYTIEYTQQRAQKMRELMEKMRKEQVRGKFKQDGSNTNITKENIIFDNIKHIPLPPKEQ